MGFQLLSRAQFGEGYKVLGGRAAVAACSAGWHGGGRSKKRSSMVASVGMLSVATCALPAAADILGYGGQVTLLTSPPASCTEGLLTGLRAFAWNEQRDVPLALTADMVNNPSHFGDGIPGWIEGRYNSHFLHFQGPPGSVFGTGGALQFDAPIVAVMFTPLGLDITDAPAGSIGTIYPTSDPLRGMGAPGHQVMSINSDILSFGFSHHSPSAYMLQARVFTLAPSPGSVTLLGAAGVLLVRRRR